MAYGARVLEKIPKKLGRQLIVGLGRLRDEVLEKSLGEGMVRELGSLLILDGRLDK